jgi:hypothetical protein
MKILASFALSFLLITLAHAAQVIGSVTKLKGEATILELGNKEAKKIVLGQSVSKEASLLTAEKSFVQVTLLDKTQVSLGPNSKIILDQTPAESVGIISLLKGKIRTEVIKESEAAQTQEKLFVKTRSAAMGVRGTNFETIFNPENNITNLITFRGAVALVKTENSDLHASLSGKNTVLVEKGTFAAISDNLKNATEPVKLSPVQYTGLKLNTEMNEEVKIPKEEFQAELKKTIKEYAEISKNELKEQNLATHNYDAAKQVLRPTAGGVVDLVTGIYVPPTIDKKNYNAELNIYELKSEKGEVNEAGNYLPPKGVILDAKKGFIQDPENQKTGISSELLKLNRDISGQVVKPSKPTKEDLSSKSEDAYEKYFKKE